MFVYGKVLALLHLQCKATVLVFQEQGKAYEKCHISLSILKCPQLLRSKLRSIILIKNLWSSSSVWNAQRILQDDYSGPNTCQISTATFLEKEIF